MQNLLFITSRFPFPLEKGDKLRAYNQIKGLSQYHNIHLVAINHKKITEEQLNQLRPFCKSITVYQLSFINRIIGLLRAFFIGLPLQVGFFYSKRIQRKFNIFFSVINPDIVHCHLIRTSEYAKSLDIRKTLDYMDCFSVGLKKRLDGKTVFFKRWFLKFEYKRVLKYERNIFDSFTEKIIISRQDGDQIPHALKKTIHVVPNGVDPAEFFVEKTEKKYDLLVTGNMSYPPNIEAAVYTIKHILPLVLKKNPDATLLIAGVGAPHFLKKMNSPNIIVRADFNHIREAFSSSRIMLAPMFMSIGQQNKILQAMAMKIPVIASTNSNRAIGAENGKEIFIADNPDGFCDRISELMTDTKKAHLIAEKAFVFVLRNYSWGDQNSLLEKIITGKS